MDGPWRSASEEETRALGAALAVELGGRGVILVDGDLGAGKTVLAQGVARGLGIDPGQVQSPTYTLIVEHAGPGGRLVHVDLYRLAPEQVEATGLEEVLGDREALVLVEWPDRIPWEVRGARRLRIRREADGTRRVEER